MRTTTNGPWGRRAALALAVLAPAARGVTDGAMVEGGAPIAEIRVVDAETGRGVPLVELETVNAVGLVTDSAGRAAFAEPELLGHEVFLHVRGHGYEVPADGFGYRGVRVVPRPGKVATIEVERTCVAERLCRLTGLDRFRDSALLGHDVPPPNDGLVAGQDSVQAAVYRGRVVWLWGDTSRAKYPLGLFRTAGATTPIPGPDDDVERGIRYDVFTGDDGFARAMVPLPERPDGVIWVDGLCSVRDADGEERLVAHYSRRASLEEELEQGVALFDDERAVFEPVLVLPRDETWRRPSTHPVRLEADGKEWLLFGSPSPNVRVEATLEAVLDPARYEAFTCLGTEDGEPRWRWQTELPPLDSATEARLVAKGELAAEDAHFLPVDAASPSTHVVLHSGTVRWNEHRGRWILVAGRVGGETSYLGEVWYSEADAPTGPFVRAVRIAAHDRQSFYNVCHHDFLDRDGGRTIFFEGTYTNTFSGNEHRTPRYDYDQLLYRLDLDADELAPTHLR
ncbi:MAG: hypothetical protein R3F34_10710 [Planctomycetota bacterium]